MRVHVGPHSERSSGGGLRGCLTVTLTVSDASKELLRGGSIRQDVWVKWHCLLSI